MATRINIPKWLPKYERWQIKVRKDGERKTFTSPIPGREGQKDCQKKADAWLEENLLDQQIRVRQLYDKWVEELESTTSTSHARQYRSFGENWVKPLIGARKVNALTEQNLQDVVLKAHAKALSKKTLGDIRTCLMSFMKYARKNKVTTLMPEDITIPKNAPESEKSILQPEDIKKLFTFSETTFRNKVLPDWFINAYRFSTVLGLRPGEMIGLKWTDVVDGTMYIRRSINQYNEVTRGKNKNAKRIIKLPNIAIEILNAQTKMLKKAALVSEYVFPKADGSFISQDSFYEFWKRYRLHNGISDTSPYELRHTFVSMNKEMPAEIIKMIVGHSKDMDTFGTYGHEVDGDLEKAARLIDATFEKILDKRG